MAGKHGMKKYSAPTEFLIAAERRRMEKQEQCGHTDLYMDAAGFFNECADCGKSFDPDEMDEIEWASEEEVTKTNAQ
jgi:hypothetical protein